MSNIQILSQDVINKIAAGEVVEKPASVVKELIDNAIDAKATNITIEIQDGGMQKILVVDNGLGMSPTEAPLAFQRHATSKIRSEEDLLTLRTYGFRGEALASIVAISKTTMKTRPGGDQLGSEIVIQGGEMISTNQVGCPSGTSILIEDLFYNVPVRKEFLKSTQNEYKYILDVVSKYAMANPLIGFTLINNGKTIYNFPKEHQLEDRIREVMGADNFGFMLPIFYEHPHIEVFGYIGKPELASDRKKTQYVFVNKRAIENKNIAFAAKQAYSTLIPKNNYPQFILFIDVPANIVDVNVHPRKEEVKFSNDKFIFDAVMEACKKALERSNLTPGSTNNMNNQMKQFGAPPSSLGATPKPFGTPPSPFGATPKPFGTPPSPFGAAPKPFGNPGSPLAPKPKPFGSGADTLNDKPFAPNPMGNANPWNNNFANKDPFYNDFNDSFDDFGNPRPQQMVMPASQTDLKLLQIHNLYIIVESQDGMIIYDQHALHERILFDKFKKIREQTKEERNTQQLTAPITLQPSVKECEILNQNLDFFNSIGFAIEDFGAKMFKITSIPEFMANQDVKKIITDMISDLDNEVGEVKEDFDNKALAYLACKSAYKAGDYIPPEEIAAMISAIDQAVVKYTCPHGRPLKIEMTKDELEKMFLRK